MDELSELRGPKPMRNSKLRSVFYLHSLVLFLLVAAPAVAQPPPAPESLGKPALSFGAEFDTGGLGAVNDGQQVSYSAEYKLTENSREGLLTVRAAIDDGWHIYSLTQQAGGPMASRLKITTSGVELLGDFTPDQAPEVKQSEYFDVPSEKHSGTVIWTAPIRIPADSDPEQFSIDIRYDGQVCTNDLGSCIPLDKIAIPAKFAGYAEAAEMVPPVAAAPSAPAANQPKARATDTKAAASGQELQAYLVMGFLGGIILNLMPCVLPVIGIKILGIAQQAGMSRARVLSLNIWFSLGLLSVFWVLATLAVTLNLGWGEQFTYTWFKVALTGVVFAMALSFLGVWEIPIPGFVGTGASNDLQKREGPSGAFFKGIFTTLLATPCSGPLLGGAFAWSLAQPPAVTYLLFTSIGLGMASPYLVIGAFPALIKFLPRPGMWMETFKQAMAFVLLATVIYLFTTIAKDYFIATLTLLFGIWFACWMIGRIPVTAELGRKTRGWMMASAAATAVGLFAFTLLVPQEKLIPWQPYSPAALAQARAEGKTVFVDFTADWCLTCKFNLRTAINTTDVQKLVKRNDIVPLLADWTDRNEEIKQAITELGSNSIPLLAVYPADENSEPIVLRDVVFESQVLKALEKAGPSKSTSVIVRTASVTP